MRPLLAGSGVVSPSASAQTHCTVQPSLTGDLKRRRWIAVKLSLYEVTMTSMYGTVEYPDFKRVAFVLHIAYYG